MHLSRVSVVNVRDTVKLLIPTSTRLCFIQVNVFSSEELRSIFIRRDDGTPSDTHDTLRCKRCPNVRAADPAITAQRNTLTQLQAEVSGDSAWLKDQSNTLIYLDNLLFCIM